MKLTPCPSPGHCPLSGSSTTGAAVDGVEDAAGGGDSMACKTESSTGACLKMSMIKNGIESRVIIC